ncbi:hypothetical protein B0920_20905 [Massilia sp. KIM]|uniref:DUF4326 domain-containing protein n=1 Tax=Massilia sp. KIM TaxID=1955422 RepID=UPI00098F1343|nr:DUF4326 domain-containing protein [Massilia sp. KIM]OON59744.1 hypothetical protein B0920_20905 [Massilia sp. KIM]
MTPQRVQLSRKKGWRMPPNTISVARPGRWGNPFSVLPELAPGTPVGRYVAMPNVEEAVAAFRRWLEEDPAGRRLAEEAKAQLAGRNLACWCPLDGPCHAQVLLELVNSRS